MVAGVRGRSPQFMRRFVNRPALRRRSSFAVFVQLLLVASGLGVGGALAYVGHRYVMEGSTFRLRSLELATTPEPLRERVRAALQPAFGVNLLVADLNALRRRVERIPEVREVTLRRVLPDTLEVGVVGREPWARLHAADGDYLMSREAIVLGPAGVAGGDLVQLRMEAALLPLLDASRRLPASLPAAATLPDATRIADWLADAGRDAFGSIAGLHLDARGVALVPTHGPALVLLGTAADLREKADRYRSLLSTDPPPPTALVDLRYRDMVVVRDLASTTAEQPPE